MGGGAKAVLLSPKSFCRPDPVSENDRKGDAGEGETLKSRDTIQGARSRPIVIVLCFLVIPCSLPGQAWLFPKGEGTVTLSYQNTLGQDQVDFQGKPWPM